MFDTTRRKLLGASMLGAGATLSSIGFAASAGTLTQKGNILLDRFPHLPQGLKEAANFPLIEAIHGRRSRRFAKGASIPDGPLAYTSNQAPEALSEMEQMLLLTTVGGNTGWSNLIPHNRTYAPKTPNYAGAAGGRTFPSAAGFHTSEIFFTDDTGSYVLRTRDMHPVSPPGADVDLNAYLEAHKSRIVKLSDGRMNIPAVAQHMEMHNEWCANVPGSTLIIPVADLAQHMILSLLYLVQNGACIFDDVNGQPIPGMAQFSGIVDVDNPFPLSYVEQFALTEITVENATSCYAGALMLQAMGLGGWMYDGLNPFSVQGASGDPDVPGLGFRFDMPDGALLPHVTGLEGIFEGHTPPHFADMREAVMSVVDRKFGAGGPFNAKTDGPYKKTETIRSNAAPISEEAINCTVTMAQYIYDQFGRFPATVPAIFNLMYLQAHKLDTGFYDTHFDTGAYLRTHKDHDRDWA
ncbi:MAG: hypothetical protein KUG62_11320 [Rhodobacteraceae bacterium]|nr:hypothetical protein [Paracoccaceae bacterium]